MISFKKIINMSRASLSGASRNVLRKMYSVVSKRADKVVNDFKKHGRLDEIPSKYLKHKNVNKMTNAQIVTEIGNISNYFLNNKAISYSAWRKQYNKGKANYRDLVGKSRVSDAEYDSYREYMKDMYELYKNTMKPSDLYNESNDLWLQSKRLNLSVEQFMDNMTKWNKRLEKLNEKIEDKNIVKGEELDLEVYKGAYKRIATWLKD